MDIKKVNSIIGEVYQVGGSVRDELLNIVPKDYDYTTPSIPNEIERLVKLDNRRAYCVGKKFGTIGFKIDGEYIEVTTFRNEKYIENSRKPQVEFVDNLKLDLSRRDFTINALAKDINGNIIDYFQGIDDLNNKIIRCVGKAKDRFKEDPLRILRAARFASQLGFQIDTDVFEHMQKQRIELLKVSKERWVQELNKLLISDNPNLGLIYLMNTGVLNIIIPELGLQYNYNQDNPHHKYDLWLHTLLVVSNLPNDLNLRWAGLLHDIGKPFVRKLNIKNQYYNYIDHEKLGAELVKKIGMYLKMSNNWIDNVSELVLNHMKEDSPLREADRKAK